MKKVFAILVAVSVLGFVLGGCNKSDDAGGTAGGTTAGGAKAGGTAGGTTAGGATAGTTGTTSG